MYGCIHTVKYTCKISEKSAENNLIYLKNKNWINGVSFLSLSISILSIFNHFLSILIISIFNHFYDNFLSTLYYSKQTFKLHSNCTGKKVDKTEIGST